MLTAWDWEKLLFSDCPAQNTCPFHSPGTACIHKNIPTAQKPDPKLAQKQLLTAQEWICRASAGVGGQWMQWEDNAMLQRWTVKFISVDEMEKNWGLTLEQQDGTRLLHPTTASGTTHGRTPPQIMSALQQARCCSTEMTVFWTTALPLQANITYLFTHSLFSAAFYSWELLHTRFHH